MYQSIRVVAIAVAMIWALCGRSLGAGVADAYLAGMNKIAGAVEQVKDDASARNAAQVIASVSKDLTATAATLDSMSEAEKASVFASRAAEMQTAQMRLATAMQGLASQPQWMRVISEEMQKLPTIK